MTVGGRGIQEITSQPVVHALEWVKSLKGAGKIRRRGRQRESKDAVALTPRQMTIAKQIVKEISARLQFMVDVGLDYLTLDRATASLSGGEAQRIRLATQIGSRLTGVLYVLDEPSIGLHPRDQARLIKTLQSMRDLGNTVLVVEHDEDTMEASDWIVDLGPGAGEHGGTHHLRRHVRRHPQR